MALFFVAGGLTTLLVLALPHPTTLQVPLMLGLGCTAPLFGLAVYLLRHRLPSSSYPWLLAIGTIIITILTGATGGYSEMVSFSFFYLWIVLYAVLFFSPLGIAVQVGVVMAGYWATSALYDDSGADKLTPLEPVVLISIIATTGTVCALLARAREASEIDPLTRVANRRGLDHALDLALQFAERSDPRLNVAMIDVDHFKTINDENGHAAGDLVLQQLTAAWRPLLRAGDSIGRRGGDEFLVVLPGCPPAVAAVVLEGLRNATPAEVTCSIGAAHWHAGDGASMLVSKADAALYEAKRNGRDRLVWAAAE
jgi:diguanylate cyclase (GGDEF)-like protein